MSEDKTPQKKDPAPSVRIDLWMWAVRIFKTRPLSAAACRAGRARIGNRPVKPSRRIRVGDVLKIEQGPLIRTIRVRGVLSRRVGAKRVEEFLEDLTSGEALARAAEFRKAARVSSGPARESGSSRPTKKERRELEDVMKEAEERETFYREMNRKIRTGSVVLLASLIAAGSTLRAEEPPSRNFTDAEGAVTFKITENFSVTAKNIAPETDPATGVFKGMSARGRVLIKFRPNEKEDWIMVSCGKATYDPSKDEVVLTRWPSVKTRGQVLRSTSEETYVRVARTTGKWEIKGPHKLELNLKELKK